MGCWRTVYFEFCLATDFVYWGLISQLGYELVRLNIDILFSWRGLWSFDISCKEFFSRLCTLLLQTLRVILSFVCLEQLIWIGACGNNHGCVSASTEDTFVVGYILRVVRLLVNISVRIFILLLRIHNSWMSSKTLSSCATWLLHHLFEFYLIYQQLQNSWIF